MGNIIFGPFEETTLCYDKAGMMKFSTYALSPGTSPGECLPYNLLPKEMCPLNNPLSPSDGLGSSQAIGGLWRGKFGKRVLTTSSEKPATKTHKCKMETDGWLQFSIYFSGIGANVVPCRCSKGSSYLCKTLVSITVGKNMEYIQI